MPSVFNRHVVVALAAVGILVTSTPVFAQGVGIGVKGGAVFASFTPGDLDLDRRTGWQAGGFLGGNDGDRRRHGRNQLHPEAVGRV